MNFYRKILLSIFFTSLLAGVALLSISLFLVQRDMKNQFLERYSKLADVIGNALLETEASVEKIGINATKHLRLIVRDRGVPSDQELKALAADLNVSQFTIADRNGRFIRDTITPPSEQTKGLFDFCDDYRKLISGATQIETTPILPSFPYKGPYKFVMIPSDDRKYILESGMHLEGIGQVLAKTIRTDENIRSISLLSPTGFNYGTFFSDGKFIDGEQQRVEQLIPGTVTLTDDSLEVVKRVAVAAKKCCECKVKNVSGDQGYFYILKIVADTTPLKKILSQAKMSAFLLTLALLLLSGLISRALAHKLVHRILLVDSAIRELDKSGNLETKIRVVGNDEISSLAQRFNQMTDSLRSSRARQLELEKATALGEQASQLAHDIRSPLVALKFAVDTLNDLPQSQRTIIHGATQRINDIANELLLKNRKGTKASGERENTLLVGLLDALVSEKRVRYRERSEVEIYARLEAGYGLFAAINAIELARAVSNLLDNSVEAISGRGRVGVFLRSQGENAVVEVIDSGPGVSPEIRDRLGEKGFSHGKLGGNGLGIYHARKTVMELGGKMEIESSPSGTLIRLIIPTCPTPAWFPSALQLKPGMSLVSVDDEETVHQAWSMRLKQAGDSLRLEHFMFTSGEKFLDWILKSRPKKALYLIDFEFSQHSLDGLELIKRAGIEGESILVTSRYESSAMRARAREQGVLILPKNLVPFIPIRFV